MSPNAKISFFISIALFFVFSIGWEEHTNFIHDHNHQQQSRAERAPEDQQINPKGTFWQRTAFDPVAVFNLFLVFFTAVLSVATIALGIGTFKLWQTSERHAGHMERSIELAHHTMVSTFRPKIQIHHIFLDFTDSVQGDKWQIIVNYINSGETNARIFDARGSLFFVSSGERIPKHFPEGEWENNPGILPPGVLGSLVVRNIGLTPYYVRDNIDRSQSALYCWGIIQYTDDLDIPRRTEFLRRYDVGSDTFMSIPGAEHERTY